MHACSITLLSATRAERANSWHTRAGHEFRGIASVGHATLSTIPVDDPVHIR
jgi:hypothetical protein